MSDWTAGYVADIGYSFGYYSELNPRLLPLAFLNAGVAPPDAATACELGFGQGVSAAVHAAASDTQWFGTDFNPAQTGFARAMAAASGSGAQLFDETFADFCNRRDLPQFDFIGLHGIWSWISDENRAVIVDFIRRKLAVGGVLYVSYNTQPGLAAMVPMRDLLAEHAEVMGARGNGIVRRVDDALAFAGRVMATAPLYAQANPLVVDRLRKLNDLDRTYLAHEYFNQHWLPMSVSRMAEWLAPARLSFACSAYYLEHVDALNLTPDQQALMREIPNTMFRQTVRDFMVNQAFRRDYWVRGARRLDMLEQLEALRAVRVVLARPRAEVPLKATGSLGEAALQEAVYGPILDALADHRPAALAQIAAAVNARGVNIGQLVEAAMVLIGTGCLVPVQDESRIAEATTRTEALNAFICDKARGSGDLRCLASPVTGGGVGVNRFQQLFLLAIRQGRKLPAEWAALVWEVLTVQGQKIVKEGRTIESAEESLAELTAQAQSFNDTQQPILKALGIG